jgi:hypothetical protein
MMDLGVPLAVDEFVLGIEKGERAIPRKRSGLENGDALDGDRFQGFHRINQYS